MPVELAVLPVPIVAPEVHGACVCCGDCFSALCRDAIATASDAEALERIVDLHEHGCATEHESWGCETPAEFHALKRSQVSVSSDVGSELTAADP